MLAVLVREFGGPDKLRVETVPDPKPGPSEVLVRIRGAGVNPVDVYIAAGTYPRKPALPYIPGSDGAGEVESVGAEVKSFAPGDRVYIAGHGSKPAGAGTYAERAVCTPAQLHRLPARATFAQGAALGVPYTTAYRALFHRAAARPGETVLVHGATGGVGIAAVQLARAHGLRVIGTGGTERGLALVRAQGADVVANHRAPDYLDAIKAATGGRGVDVVIEMAAHINLDKDLSLLAPRGRVVVVGNRGRVEIDPRQAMARDAAILGMAIFNISETDFASIQAALVAGLGNGTVAPVIAQELPLVDAGRAHAAIMESGAVGKIVLLT
jgi:NADPH2:quinone reductase